MATKIPCGGFWLDDSFTVNEATATVSLGGNMGNLATAIDEATAVNVGQVLGVTENGEVDLINSYQPGLECVFSPLETEWEALPTVRNESIEIGKPAVRYNNDWIVEDPDADTSFFSVVAVLAEELDATNNFYKYYGAVVATPHVFYFSRVDNNPSSLVFYFNYFTNVDQDIYYSIEWTEEDGADKVTLTCLGVVVLGPGRLN